MFQKISKCQKFPAIQLLWNGQVKYFYKFVMPKLVCYSVAMDWPSQFKFKNIQIQVFWIISYGAKSNPHFGGHYNYYNGRDTT